MVPMAQDYNMLEMAPGDFAVRYMNEHGLGTERGAWYGLVSSIARSLETNPEAFVLTFDRNEQERLFPLLGQVHFRADESPESRSNHTPHHTTLFTASDLELTLDSETKHSPEKLNAISERVQAVAPFLYQTFERYRQGFVNTKFDLPAEKGLKHYVDVWKERALRAIRSGGRPRSLSLFQSDLVLFGQVNKVAGEKQGDSILEHTGYSLIYEMRDQFPDSGDWYVAHAHGDNFYWAVQGIEANFPKSDQSPQAQHIEKLSQSLKNKPVIITRPNSHSRLQVPLFLSIGWQELSVLGEYDPAIEAANQHMIDHKARHKHQVEELYKEIGLIVDRRGTGREHPGVTD